MRMTRAGSQAGSPTPTGGQMWRDAAGGDGGECGRRRATECRCLVTRAYNSLLRRHALLQGHTNDG